MIEPREIVLPPEAVQALTEILGIMADEVMRDPVGSRWDIPRLVELEERLLQPAEGDPVTLGIDDAALLLDGMAFTEVMSEELPWIDMVRWTADFVTAELRQHWTPEQWSTYVGRD